MLLEALPCLLALSLHAGKFVLQAVSFFLKLNIFLIEDAELVSPVFLFLVDFSGLHSAVVLQLFVFLSKLFEGILELTNTLLIG